VTPGATARLLASVVALLALLDGRLLAAQAPSAGQPPGEEARWRAVARLDVFVSRYAAVQVGGGASMRIDHDLRLDLTAAVGSSWAQSGAGLSGRGDALMRFLIDPDRVKSWGLYAAGGVGTRYDEGDGWRAELIALIGAQFRQHAHVMPFVEAGFGGGVRVGGGVRW